MPIRSIISGSGGTTEAGKLIRESLTVLAQNTLSDLSNTPLEVNSVCIFVEGVKQNTGIDFTMSGKSINWISPNINVNVGDTVVAIYEI